MACIGVFQTGYSNSRSIQSAFEKILVDVDIITDPKDLERYKKIVIPGIGHFGHVLQRLKNDGTVNYLNDMIQDTQNLVLGICLGMQLMTNFSEEGETNGLGWIDAKTHKFQFADYKLKIPHMGWNNLHIITENPLLKNINEGDYFYFIHSYHIQCIDKKNIVATTEYGQKFVSVFNKNNIFGCQFHPEKSHDAGLKILKNFSKM